MAAACFITKLSRRTMLAGGSAAAVSGIAAPLAAPVSRLDTPAAIANPADARLARLAAEYRRALEALTDWLGEAEERGGLFAYDEEPYRARYQALIARADWLVADLARTRPDSIVGLAIKLRVAVYRHDLDNTLFDCDERLMLPALDDADRMAAAMFGVG